MYSVLEESSEIGLQGIAGCRISSVEDITRRLGSSTLGCEGILPALPLLNWEEQLLGFGSHV